MNENIFIAALNVDEPKATDAVKPLHIGFLQFAHILDTVEQGRWMG